jgi:hypothetical protein
VLALPCQHLAMCGACAEKANYFAGGPCAMCRRAVTSTLGPIYLP